MRQAHPVEREVGIEYYVTDSDGTGGRLRVEPEDFRVRELEQFASEPIDASAEKYPHLLVRATLRRWDTNDFARELSNRLGISRERVSWAGTKDKHAVTTQLFSIEGITFEALPEISGVEFEPVGRTGRAILFGDLAGNAFEIRVRDADNPERATEITADLRAFGGGDRVTVPNFFGQQRFGSKRPVSHEIGLAMVREQWDQAVMTYVGNASEREPEETQQARRFVEETREWGEALDRMPEYLGYERSIIHELDRRTDGGARTAEEADFRAALAELPDNLTQLFVNAAQSYLFNQMLSKRLDRGLPFDEPVEGDVVCFADSDAPSGLELPDQDRTQRVTESRLRSVRRHCERGRAFVTAPLVGTETEFAEGEPGEIEREVLADAELEPGDFEIPDEYTSTGTRRAVLVRTTLDVETDPLELSFSLPRGSYATVMLREYLKTDPANL
ncbi:tRNA pseudouridine(13) synthase TruD [Halovenus sp. WSH3]|uniref:Probable tRNA pseudouridine synthase D n=1 Tax=Halovenus carboxidivorans TaxID=2692199 RepID=A0A6B0TDL7_9EURY|nr:tRNA pseudouridine(13) synthase TruD [Halovenus carboxidivorans]MXR51289.1 tRNA pseudouridine(13) synthase TruD [Halovenus carboxidivorans]